MRDANAEGTSASQLQADSRTSSSVLSGKPAFLFDLDGTLVDSVYQHVLAWREALEACGIELSVWRIHRRVGMSGGLMANAILRETGHQVTAEEAARLFKPHAEAHARSARQVRWRDIDCYMLQERERSQRSERLVFSVREA